MQGKLHSFYLRKKGEGSETILQIGPMPVSTVRLDYGPNQLVYYPHVFYKFDQSWENEMNETIKEQVHKQIAQQVGEMPTSVEEMQGLYEIKNNQWQVLS